MFPDEPELSSAQRQAPLLPFPFFNKADILM